MHHTGNGAAAATTRAAIARASSARSASVSTPARRTLARAKDFTGISTAAAGVGTPRVYGPTRTGGARCGAGAVTSVTGWCPGLG